MIIPIFLAVTFLITTSCSTTEQLTKEEKEWIEAVRSDQTR
jgi:hypothetical protein